MKIKKVKYKSGSDEIIIVCLNRKKEIEFKLSIAKLNPGPDQLNPIIKVIIDKDLGGQGVEYTLKDGQVGAIHLDAFREAAGDPEYYRELALYRATVLLEEAARYDDQSKQRIAHKLGTSAAHVYRVFDTSYYGKTLDQIVKTLAVLGYRSELIARSITHVNAEAQSSSEKQLDKFKYLSDDQKSHYRPERFRGLKVMEV